MVVLPPLARARACSIVARSHIASSDVAGGSISKYCIMSRCRATSPRIMATATSKSECVMPCLSRNPRTITSRSGRSSSMVRRSGIFIPLPRRMKRTKDLITPDDIIAITGWKLSTMPEETRSGNLKPYSSPLDKFLSSHGIKYYRGAPGLTHRYSRAQVLSVKDKLAYRELMAKRT